MFLDGASLQQLQSINLHIANSMQKLNATNKISATIKAALLGFL